MIDPSLPWLEDAMDLEKVNAFFCAAGILSRDELVTSARIARHREGRRCLIEYELSTSGGETVRTVLGKSRAKGLDRRSVRNLRDLRARGFASDAPDGISVPEVLAVVEPWRMWVTTKVGWKSYGDFTSPTERIENARRAARCARKLNEARLHGVRRHSIDDELTLLDGFLDQAARERPSLRERIEYLKELARIAASTISDSPPSLIHRDFYPDQLLFDADRAMILDLDLVAEGDSRLDIGNFTAHLVEHSIRERGNVLALEDERDAFINEYTASEDDRNAILAYEAISLARHVWITIRIVPRNSSTPLILEEALRRLENIERSSGIAL